MQRESEPAAAGNDYLTAFARKHRLDERELRYCIAIGPSEVRWFLQTNGILDDYPRRAATARGDDGEPAK